MRWHTVLGAFALLLTIAALLPLFVQGQQSDSSWLISAVLLGSLMVGLGALYLSHRQQIRYDKRLSDVAAELAAQRERLALAEHLHDLVSHRLGAITVQASTAAFLGEPASQARALQAIERVSREASADMRDLLLALRSGTPHDESEVELSQAIRQGREAGLQIMVEGLDREIAASPHRRLLGLMVQETLANAARYCGPTHVWLTFTGGDAVRLTITDAGPVAGWRANPGAGTGLATLAERCSNAGGEVSWGSVGDGFTVAASLPVMAGADG